MHKAMYKLVVSQLAFNLYFYLAPTIPPLNLTADSFYSLSTLPVHWIKVPPELTKGYIIGYRLYIKLISVGLEEVPDAPKTEIILEGQPSSYVFENLDYFSKFQIYLVAYTVGGDSPRSNTIYAGEGGLFRLSSYFYVIASLPTSH